MTTLSQYFQTYINNVTNSSSNNITAIAQIPQDVPLETLIALTTYRPQIIQGTVLQRNTQTSASVRAAMEKRLQQSGVLTNNLRNFTPTISGSAVQRRRGGGKPIPLNPRDIILRGLKPTTRKLVRDLEDLRILRELQNRLQNSTDRLEQQINKYTAIFNALVNSVDAALTAGLTFLIDKLEQLEQLYNSAKALYLLVKRAADNTRKAILKALFKDIPRFRENVKKTLDVMRKVLKLREIPRIVLFPKFPKLPKLNFTFADFYARYKLALTALKNKNSQFYDKAYSTAIQQSGFEIADPNKDVIQRGLQKARNSLRQARADLQVKQATRTAAVNQARNELINNIRQTNRTVERERNDMLKQYQNKKAKAQAGIQSVENTITSAESIAAARLTTALRNVETGANAASNLLTAYGTLVGGLNNDVLKLEVTRNILQEAQTVNQIAQSGQQIGTSEINTGTPSQETNINEETKTITTISRRLRVVDALAEVELLNRNRAQELGYSDKVSVDAPQPIEKQINGQPVYEARLTITYA
jgi:hypothetical protein